MESLFHIMKSKKQKKETKAKERIEDQGVTDQVIFLKYMEIIK